MQLGATWLLSVKCRSVGVAGSFGTLRSGSARGDKNSDGSTRRGRLDLSVRCRCRIADRAIGDQRRGCGDGDGLHRSPMSFVGCRESTRPRETADLLAPRTPFHPPVPRARPCVNTVKYWSATAPAQTPRFMASRSQPRPPAPLPNIPVPATGSDRRKVGKLTCMNDVSCMSS